VQEARERSIRLEEEIKRQTDALSAAQSTVENLKQRIAQRESEARENLERGVANQRGLLEDFQAKLAAKLNALEGNLSQKMTDESERLILARKLARLEDYITLRHIDAMCKLVLATSCMVGTAYATEFFTAWYSGNPYERFVFVNRALGPMAWAYWIMVFCNVAIPQFLWSPSVRRSTAAVFVLSLFVNIGMWFERFVIIVTSLHRDFLPSSWASYSPTIVELAIFAGSFGLFFTLFLLFCRFLPMIAMAEVKGVLVPEARA
ncbi:MAG: NrfD/PsrC family molybdoenzyme membrane anchor subunit, partial [Elusimicrobiota bacterium]